MIRLTRRAFLDIELEGYHSYERRGDTAEWKLSLICSSPARAS